MQSDLEKPDAIICSDLHLSPHKPPCRTEDNYTITQINKLAQIERLRNKYQCPVLCGGDVFDRWYVSKTPSLIPGFLSSIMLNFPANMWAIPGQHDLPAHNYDLLNESAYWTLVRAGMLNSADADSGTGIEVGEFNLYGFPFGAKLRNPDSIDHDEYNVALIHTLTYTGKKPFPGKIATVDMVMRRLDAFDLIVCGDNHKSFTKKKGDQLFVSPGSMLRTEAGQMDHKHKVYLWYMEDVRLVPVELQLEHEISREHLDVEEERDEHISQFVDKLKTNFEAALSFEKNMEMFLMENEVDKLTITKIREAIDG